MSKNSFQTILAIALLSSALSVPTTHAATIVSGSANFTLQEGLSSGIDQFDALFSGTTSRADTLSLAAPGNVAFTNLGASVQFVDPIRPNGEVPSPYPGTPGSTRSPQITNLDFNPVDILGSWAASTDQFGVFAPLGSGEQIALTLMQRWTSTSFTGSLLYGDFGLRYLPGRAGTSESGGTLSGLVLTSNIDFLNASWADLANASISFSGNTLSISGDLLVSGGLNTLDPTATVGTKFGTFNMTALVVPEPSTGMLLLAAMAGFAGSRRRSAAAA